MEKTTKEIEAACNQSSKPRFIVWPSTGVAVPSDTKTSPRVRFYVAASHNEAARKWGLDEYGSDNTFTEQQLFQVLVTEAIGGDRPPVRVALSMNIEVS